MADTSETKNTILGIMLGAGCLALLIFCTTGSGALSASSSGRTCTTCRQPPAALNLPRGYIPTVTMTRE